MRSQSTLPESNPGLALVGDFGGTNARLALVDLTHEVPVLSNVRHFIAREYPRATDTIAAYLAAAPERPSLAVVAAAGPVNRGTVHFTNSPWSISEEELVRLGLSAARIINDFVAVALATRVLSEADVHQLGSGHPDKHKTAAVMGPGTGFGASALVVDSEGRQVAMAAEAGHTSFAPGDETEIEVLRILQREFEHVSNERILSGPGLCNLHRALNAIEGIDDSTDDAEAITRSALAGETHRLRTVERFCAILGAVAGDLALAYGAQGGVYIAGGIAPGIVPILSRSEFRKRFESKGRFADYLRPIATQIITRADVAFLGAAHAARELRSVRPR